MYFQAETSRIFTALSKRSSTQSPHQKLRAEDLTTTLFLISPIDVAGCYKNATDNLFPATESPNLFHLSGKRHSGLGYGDTEPERRFRGKSGDLDVVGENGEYISLGMAPIRPINAGIPES